MSEKSTEELINEISKDNFITKTPEEIIDSIEGPNDSTIALKNKVYIKQIYFPFYKNFEKFSKIDFNFPLRF